jgi:hypothetical protein
MCPSAGRIARINFIVLELTTTVGSTDAVKKCAEDLTAVFNRGAFRGVPGQRPQLAPAQLDPAREIHL